MFAFFRVEMFTLRLAEIGPVVLAIDIFNSLLCILSKKIE